MATPSSASTTAFKFIIEPDDELKCLICLGIARDPLQHEACGKLFCKECLETHGKDKPCLNCRDTKSHYYVDKRSRRNIQALRVKCSNNIDKECKWEGTVEALEDHMATCEFTLLPCPKECKDDHGDIKHILRRDILLHLTLKCPNRKYLCNYCGKEGTYATITEKHVKTCPKKIVPCPNPDCKLTMQRQETEEHVRSTCAHTVIPCKYESIGCDMRKKRRDMPDHEQDDKLHLHMALDTTLQLKKDLQSAVRDNTNLRRDLQSAVRDNTDLRKDLQSAVKNNTDLRKDLQSANTDLRKDLQSAVSILQRSLKGEPKDELQSATHILQLSLTGEPLYKLTDYQKKKEDGGEFTFPAFYTYPCGYHMALKVDANGYGRGEGTHASVFASVVAGEYDAELKWPCLDQVTFTLLNQLEDKNHHSKPMTLVHESNVRVGRNRGFHQFISHSALGYDPIKNTQYLKDDTLYFRMSVQPAN